MHTECGLATSLTSIALCTRVCVRLLTIGSAGHNWRMPENRSCKYYELYVALGDYAVGQDRPELSLLI